MRFPLLAYYAICLALCCACARPDVDSIERQRTLLARHVAEVQRTKQDVARLDELTHAVTLQLIETAKHYEAASAKLEQARRNFDSANVLLAQAIADYDTAVVLWQLSQAMMVAITAMHLRTERGYRSADDSGCSCEDNMSPATFRRRAIAAGVDVTGKDVDHKLPLSLGGANNACNYRLIDSSENRSWGATWNHEKCASMGMQACAAAIAISALCGSYTGGFPD